TYDGFEWIEHTNHQESIIAFERINNSGEKIIAVFNFTPVGRKNYPIGVDHLGTYRTILNTDQAKYGGNLLRRRHYKSKEEPMHGREYSIRPDLPPLGGVILKRK
ncbi:MAG TPA: alpha amylase C-terminal domain-containing protein, partial [Clostridia bacterium]|nr:alpha amylase C-terminal domain-containing protein [Clostridia bacterium]